MTYVNCWVVTCTDDNPTTKDRFEDGASARAFFKEKVQSLLQQSSLSERVHLYWYDAEGKQHLQAEMQTFSDA